MIKQGQKQQKPSTRGEEKEKKTYRWKVIRVVSMVSAVAEYRSPGPAEALLSVVSVGLRRRGRIMH